MQASSLGRWKMTALKVALPETMRCPIHQCGHQCGWVADPRPEVETLAAELDQSLASRVKLARRNQTEPGRKTPWNL